MQALTRNNKSNIWETKKKPRLEEPWPGTIFQIFQPPESIRFPFVKLANFSRQSYDPTPPLTTWRIGFEIHTKTPPRRKNNPIGVKKYKIRRKNASTDKEQLFYTTPKKIRQATNKAMCFDISPPASNSCASVRHLWISSCPWRLHTVAISAQAPFESTSWDPSPDLQQALGWNWLGRVWSWICWQGSINGASELT